MNRKLPAYPLFVKDPNFSLWSACDELNSGNPQSWFGEEKPVYGFLKIKDETYCFLGNASEFACYGVKAATQTSLEVTAFSTDYAFAVGDATLRLRFVSPLPPDDLDLLSMPVCYMEYEVTGASEVELSVFVNRRVCYNSPNGEKLGVRGGAIRFEKFESAFFGLKRQFPLSNNSDCMGADWGYYYLSGQRAYFLDERDLVSYLVGNNKNFSYRGEDHYIGSVDDGNKGVVMLAYDETVAIDYFGAWKKGWYLENHTVIDALNDAYCNREQINAQLGAFDERLKEKAKKYGENYYLVLVASLRQSVAAHKLIRGKDGKALFLSKECNSGGCIATVDVSYPSMPLYLLYNPELVKGMLRPIFEFARMPVWEYDFAPHDAGVYPACCGQAYGVYGDGGVTESERRYYGNFFEYGVPKTHFPYYLLPAGFNLYVYARQMPVEECADMLVMLYACYKADGDLQFYQNNADLAEKWVRYLVQFGLKPEEQLCTDDFAGRMKNNVNLAVKATVGIGSYAMLCKASGDACAYEKYISIAKNFAAELTKFGKSFPRMPISWDADETTFSLKYNFAFDKLLDLHLFPQELFETETDAYLAEMNEYGTPLDNRAGFTKSDWLLWVAALTDDESKRERFVNAVANFLIKSPDRVPFADWYETKDGKYHYFRARTVQGGCFILLML